jgi:hypothetical protein
MNDYDMDDGTKLLCANFGLAGVLHRFKFAGSWTSQWERTALAR